MILEVIFANNVDLEQSKSKTNTKGPHRLPVCKNRFEKFSRIFSRQHKQMTFKMQVFLAF